LPVTVAIEVKSGAPVQEASLGPKTLKVMLPAGLNPPAKVAVSAIVPPTVTAADAAVVNVGVTAVTVTDSPLAPQAVSGMALLLASPL
jgi:hypothetical protein